MALPPEQWVKVASLPVIVSHRGQLLLPVYCSGSKESSKEKRTLIFQKPRKTKKTGKNDNGRGGRAADCTGLENRRRRKASASSNLAPSACVSTFIQRGKKSP